MGVHRIRHGLMDLIGIYIKHLSIVIHKMIIYLKKILKELMGHKSVPFSPKLSEYKIKKTPLLIVSKWNRIL